MQSKKRTPGDFIKEVIRKTGLTQRQVAKRLEISEVAVSNWVRNIYFPDPVNLQRLLNLLPERVNAGDCFHLPSDRNEDQAEMRAIAREEARALIEDMKQERAPPKRKTN